MTAPSLNDAENYLQIQLAKLGGVSLKDETTIFAAVGGVATLVPGVAGKWLGFPQNQRLVSLAVFGVIAASHIIGRNIRHAAVEKHNAAVKTAVISAVTQVGGTIDVASSPNISGSLALYSAPDSQAASSSNSDVISTNDITVVDVTYPADSVLPATGAATVAADSPASMAYAQTDNTTAYVAP